MQATPQTGETVTTPCECRVKRQHIYKEHTVNPNESPEWKAQFEKLTQTFADASEVILHQADYTRLLAKAIVETASYAGFFHPKDVAKHLIDLM
jgi:hypothetical protein